MRKNRICTKCNSDDLLYIPVVADAVGRYGTKIQEPVKHEANGITDPFRIVCQLQKGKTKESNWRINTSTSGVVEAYICRDCEYTEFYTKSAKDIRVDGKHVIALKQKGEHPPYR